MGLFVAPRASFPLGSHASRWVSARSPPISSPNAPRLGIIASIGYVGTLEIQPSDQFRQSRHTRSSEVVLYLGHWPRGAFPVSRTGVGNSSKFGPNLYAFSFTHVKDPVNCVVASLRLALGFSQDERG